MPLWVFIPGELERVNLELVFDFGLILLTTGEFILSDDVLSVDLFERIFDSFFHFSDDGQKDVFIDNDV